MAPDATYNNYLHLQNHQLYNPYTHWRTVEEHGTDIQGRGMIIYVPYYLTIGIR